MKYKLIFAGATVLLAGLMLQAGNLNPPPGPVQSTMVTLDEILDEVQAGSGGSSGVPVAAPFPNDPLFAGVPLASVPDLRFMTVNVNPGLSIPGESMLPGFEDTIGVSNAVINLHRIVPIGGGGAGVGAKTWEPVRILANLDRSFPRLMELAAQATPLDSVRVDFLRDVPGNDPELYMSYVIRNAIISNIFPLPQYRQYVVEYAFDCVRVEYILGQGPGSKMIVFEWDVAGGGGGNCPAP